jgi:hypothetical protein
MWKKGEGEGALSSAKSRFDSLNLVASVSAAIAAIATVSSSTASAVSVSATAAATAIPTTAASIVAARSIFALMLLFGHVNFGVDFFYGLLRGCNLAVSSDVQSQMALKQACVPVCQRIRRLYFELLNHVIPKRDNDSSRGVSHSCIKDAMVLVVLAREYLTSLSHLNHLEGDGQVLHARFEFGNSR